MKVTESQTQELNGFLEELKANNRSPVTLKNYSKTIIKFGSKYPKAFKEITKAEVMEFINSIENDATRNLYKIQLKYFYRWLYELPKHNYPKQVKWIQSGRVKTKVTKDKLLTPDEITRVIRNAGGSRNKALIATLWEAGDRPAEHLSLKVGSVEQADFGYVLHVQKSKTEIRSIPIHQTVDYLKRWLNDHPQGDNPDAPLWISLSPNNYGEALGYIGLLKVMKQAKRKAGIKKPLSPKWLRHCRLTDLAKKVRESQLKAFAGWTADSKMIGVYVHLAGLDTVEPILEAEGVQKPKVYKPTLERIECPRCKNVNEPTALYCMKCGSPLKVGIMMATKPTTNEEILRLREKMNHMERQLQFFMKHLPALNQQLEVKETFDYGYDEEER